MPDSITNFYYGGRVFHREHYGSFVIVDIIQGAYGAYPGFRSDTYRLADRTCSGRPETASPSDVAYDDMTAAWRDGDYPLAWHLADALLQYLTNGGQPLTGDRDRYYADRIHLAYAP